jgi:hypothetical protein
VKNWRGSNLKLFLVAAVAVSLGFGLKSINWPAWFSNQDRIDIDSLTGEYDRTETTAFFNNQQLQVPSPAGELGPVYSLAQVLGDSSPVPIKRIAVDLTQQRLRAFEGNQLKYDFLISSGTWDRTPTGVFKIWSKFRYTKMSGGSQALGTYYYLPNVPYVMFFYNNRVGMASGYSLHGTYWHDNFGTPMSHGCVNMKTEEAEQIFYWSQPDLRGGNSIRASAANSGTKILIYGDSPPN